MKVDIRSIGGHVATLALVALRSFAATILVLSLAGVVLAALSYYFLREHPWIYGVSAIALALMESVTVGIVLGAKRAVLSALAHGLGSLRLGGSLVRLVFERMLGTAEEGKLGERGGQMARTMERLPLVQAEERLTSAIRDVLGDAEQAGWWARKVQTRLLQAVRKYTLARFREEDAHQGGVDLLKVKDELERTVDDALVRKVRGGRRPAALLVIICLPLLVAAQTWVITMLLHVQE